MVFLNNHILINIINVAHCHSWADHKYSRLLNNIRILIFIIHVCSLLFMNRDAGDDKRRQTIKRCMDQRFRSKSIRTPTMTFRWDMVGQSFKNGPDAHDDIWEGRPRVDTKGVLLIGPFSALRVHLLCVFHWSIIAWPLKMAAWWRHVHQILCKSGAQYVDSKVKPTVWIKICTLSITSEVIIGKSYTGSGKLSS